MRIMKKGLLCRTVSALTALVTLVCALSACGNDAGNDSVSGEDTARVEMLTVVSDGKSDYTIVRGDSASEGEIKLAVAVREAIKAATGAELTLTVSGNAFLYNMVRIIAGTMLDIGMGRLAQDAFARALESGDRLALGITAPAKGLELTEVRYAPAP